MKMPKFTAYLSPLMNVAYCYALKNNTTLEIIVKGYVNGQTYLLPSGMGATGNAQETRDNDYDEKILWGWTEVATPPISNMLLKSKNSNGEEITGNRIQITPPMLPTASLPPYPDLIPGGNLLLNYMGSLPYFNQLVFNSNNPLGVPTALA